MTSTSFGAPTATYVKTIDVSSAVNFPTGIDIYNGNLYVTTFNDRKLVKVTAPLSVTPTLTTIADFSTSITWPAGRGLISVNCNQATGDKYVAGENGSQGILAIVNAAEAVTYSSIATTTPRYMAFDRFGTTSTVFAAPLLASSIMRYFDTSVPPPGNPPTEITPQAAAAAAPYNSNFRDGKVSGNRVYYSRNGTTPDGYARYDAVTPNTLAGATATGIYQTTGTNTVSAMGLGVFNDGVDEYVVVPDRSGRTVQFVNAATNVVALTISHPAFALNAGLIDACVGTISGTKYLFVTHAGSTSPTGDSVEVFQLNGFANVNDWEMY
ncbi:MAG: hypothetical protein K1X53_10815 [Candidatus Sumerlaeaceae bacterium]|nr:hypothetical protein [Candidatus Sumerlaeaceae bacterium]